RHKKRYINIITEKHRNWNARNKRPMKSKLARYTGTERSLFQKWHKLEKAELKPGQRAAIVILLYYHDLKAEARANSLANLKQNSDLSDVASRGRTRQSIR